jgi:hypothetical protein
VLLAFFQAILTPDLEADSCRAAAGPELKRDPLEPQ